MSNVTEFPATDWEPGWKLRSLQAALGHIAKVETLGSRQGDNALCDAALAVQRAIVLCSDSQKSETQ